MIFLLTESDLTPNPSPEAGGEQNFSRVFGRPWSPKNSNLMHFSPFPTGKGVGGLGLARKVANWGK
jgi:hypothetical protein